MLQRIAFRGKTNAIILFSPLPCERFPAEFALSNVITIVSDAIKRNDIWWYSVFLQTCDKFIFVHMLVVSSAEQQGVITYVLRDQHGAVVVVGGRCAIDGLLRADSVLVVGIGNGICTICRTRQPASLPRHRVTAVGRRITACIVADYFPVVTRQRIRPLLALYLIPPTSSAIDFSWIAIQIIRPLRPVKVDAVLSRSNRVPRFQFC